MSAQVLINIDEQDRLSGHPTVRHFITTDEAVDFARVAVACNCQGDVVAVFGSDGEEVDPSVYQNAEVQSAEEPSTSPLPRPAANAPKPEWQRYADSIGFDHTGLTRDQIISQTEES